MWTSNYPNPAFIPRQPGDTDWAAKQVLAVTGEEIPAIVDSVEYGDPRTVDYITQALANRRAIIGRTYFTQVLALESYRLENGTLVLEDLAVKHGFAPPRTFSFAWFRFDDLSQLLTPSPAATSAALPAEWSEMTQGELAARIAGDKGRQSVTLFPRKSGSGTSDIAGLERTW